MGAVATVGDLATICPLRFNHEEKRRTMDKTPEIDAILSDLTDLCIQVVNGESSTSSERVDALVNSLAMNGWERKSGGSAPLSVQLRKRVEEASSMRPSYHAEQLEGIIQHVQKAYDRAVRFSSSVPEEQKPPGEKSENEAAPPRTTLNASTRL